MERAPHAQAPAQNVGVDHGRGCGKAALTRRVTQGAAASFVRGGADRLLLEIMRPLLAEQIAAGNSLENASGRERRVFRSHRRP
jgi:hypothetical protein